MSRIGIFGGSFDPPHLGHLGVALGAADQLHLDTVLWVPARHSPFKLESEVTTSEHRIAMARLMASQDARFDLDLREMNRPGPSYTIDTIRSIKSDRINSTLFLLVGADSYIDFPRWKDASTIRSLTQLVVYQRDTHSGQHSEFELQHGDILLNGAPLLGSSTEIRETRAKNNRIDQWVTPEVAAYIKANELYLAD